MKHWKWFVGVAIALVFLCLVYEFCSAKQKAIELKLEYDQLKEQTDHDGEVYLNAIDDKNEVIMKLNEKIVKKDQDIQKKNDKLRKKDNELFNLEDQLIETKDKDEIIENLRAQIGIWKDKFSLAEKIIQDKDEIIFSLSEKYEAQLKISNSYKGLYENEQQLHKLAIERLVVANKRLSTSVFSGRIKTVLLAGLGGVIAINLVR